MIKSMKDWRVWLGTGALVIAVLFGCLWHFGGPVFQYRITGSLRHFNSAVSQHVANHDSFEKMESIVGPGTRLADTDPKIPGLIKMVEKNPHDNPDGWQTGDAWIEYGFASGFQWQFQVRAGRIINFDPAVLAGQPQDHIAIIGG